MSLIKQQDWPHVLASLYTVSVSVNPSGWDNNAVVASRRKTSMHWVLAVGAISSQGSQFRTTNTRLLAECSPEKMLSLSTE